MSHDMTHCFDCCDECPKDCYRAEMTRALKTAYYPYPTSWASFKGTPYCPKWPNKKESAND